MFKKIAFLVVLLLPLQVFATSVNSFTKGMKKNSGFYTFYYDQDKGKLYVELDKFGEAFIFQSSMPSGLGSNDIGLDRGQLGETRLVQFERFGNKVLLKQLNPYFRAGSDNPAERQSVSEAFAVSVIAGFEIVASDKPGKGKTRVLIDYSGFLLSDINGITRRLTAKKQGSYKIDPARSVIYPSQSRAFPLNTELEAMLTFSGSKPGKFVKQVAPDPYSLTVRLHHSFIQLPDDDYQPRVFSPYAGFWSIEHKDYSTAIDETMEKRVIPRHRLKKKDPSASVSEAVEPIVYYLDPGVPEPVRSALLDGARWWNQAFTAIGYKDAFEVKMLPVGADPMDVRFNVIQWVHRATRGWSYGSSVIDPRSGEILKGHVTLGSLRVRQDLLIAQGLIGAFDGDTDKLEAAKAMALDRIRQLAAHEVGHTLGIAHNFAASGSDRASVMDYPHPLVTIDDQGELALSDAYAKGIGAWDKYVIAYGYSDFDGDEAKQLKQLKQLQQQAKGQGFAFISDPDARSRDMAHPAASLWDNGDDPVAELQRMIKVRQKALAGFGLDSIPQGMSLSSLEEKLVPIYLFHRYQAEAAAKLVGGVDYSYEVKSAQPLKGSHRVAPQRQKAALSAILATITPDFLTLNPQTLKLLLPKAYGESRYRESFNHRTGVTFDPVSVAEVAARHSVELLLRPQRLNRLQQQAARVNGGLSVAQLVTALLQHSVKAPEAEGLKGQIRQRVSHVVIELLMQQILSDKVAPEVKAVLYHEVMALVPWLSNALEKRQPDDQGAYALLKQQLLWFEQTGQWQAQFKLLDLPPGSPI